MSVLSVENVQNYNLKACRAKSAFFSVRRAASHAPFYPPKRMSKTRWNPNKKGETLSICKGRVRQHLSHHNLAAKRQNDLVTPQQGQRGFGSAPCRRERPESLGAHSVAESARSFCTAGSGTGWSKGSEGLSTTSKKTMESLSASVYEELEPFRLAHRTLIKVRGGILARDGRQVLAKTSCRVVLMLWNQNFGWGGGGR